MQNFVNNQQQLVDNYSPKHQLSLSSNVRSNTLDRKFRQSIQIDNRDGSTQNSNSLSFKLFSSSLERNKRLQQQQLMTYNQQCEQINKQQHYSNESKKMTISKKHLNQDIILENPNTISLSASNENLINFDSNHDSTHNQ